MKLNFLNLLILTQLFFFLAGVYASTDVSVPKNLDEINKVGEKAATESKKIPSLIEKIWNEKVIPVWQKMGNWFKEHIWNPILHPFLNKEIEKRKPMIKQDFEKEKQEMKESIIKDTPKIKEYWEKFLNLFK